MTRKSLPFFFASFSATADAQVAGATFAALLFEMCIHIHVCVRVFLGFFVSKCR
jgi:hypothetical protein